MLPDPQWIHAARPRPAALQAIREAGLGAEIALLAVREPQARSIPAVGLLDVSGQACAAHVLCPLSRSSVNDFAERWEDFYTQRLGTARPPDRSLRRLIAWDRSAELFGPPRSASQWWLPAVTAIALACRRFSALPDVQGTSVILDIACGGIRLEMGARRHHVWSPFIRDYRRVRSPASDANMSLLQLAEQSSTQSIAAAYPALATKDRWALAALVRRLDLGLEPPVEMEELLQEVRSGPSLQALEDILNEGLTMEQLHRYLVPEYLTATAFRTLVGNAYGFPDRLVRHSTLNRIRQHLGAA